MKKRSAPKKRPKGPTVKELATSLAEARGRLQSLGFDVSVIRKQYAEMKKQMRGGTLGLDLVPGVDWHNLLNMLDFEAEVFNVCDDGEYGDP